MHDPKYFTKSGRLNRYALACGYVERAESGNDEDYRSVTLYMDGSVLHVTCYKRNGSEREQFSTNKITEARTVFASKLREYNLYSRRSTNCHRQQ